MIKPKQKQAENTLNFLTEEECLAQEKRHMQRLQDVRISVAFIHNINKEYKELKAEKLKLEKWNDYTACDGMPRPDFPGEIRHYLFKLRHDEHNAAVADVNWPLAINEQSILSHAPDRQDLTRRNLEVIMKADIGKLYEKTVQGLLHTHMRVERVLRNDEELFSMPSLRALELAKIPGELYEEIETFFDKLAYRVICAPEAYMTNKGNMFLNYCYNCSNFNFQIWGLHDVPIRFQYLRLPLMHSDLKCIEATIQLPLSVLSDNLTLRCVHTFFDPVSHLAKSYNLNIDTETNPTCGILEIDDSLMSEWMAQTEIQDQLTTMMEAQMEDYKTTMAAIDEALAAKQKKQGENVKGPPVPKAPKMPLAIPEGKLPNAYPLFLKQNRQECTNFFNENFHPDNINLLENEVNLRRYIIVGGVISIVFVRKPRHTAFEKFNLTLHEDGRVLQVVLDQLNRSRQLSSTGQYEEELGSTRQNIEMTDSDLKLHLEPNELPFYFITFRVPKQLCLWSDPMVCQFIEEEIEIPTIENDFVDQELEKKNKKKNSRKEKGKKAATRSNGDKHIDEAPSTRQSEQHQLNGTLVNMYRETAMDTIRKRHTETELISTESVENFELNVGPLTRQRATLVKKICIPRIISSFKFPQEFKDEHTEEQPTKKTTGPIYRRRFTDSVATGVIKEFTLSYEDQTDPERLFPLFPEPEVSNKVRKYVIASRNAEVPTFHENLFGLLKTLDGIKEKYEESPKKLEQQTVAPAVVTMCKRRASDIRESSNRAITRPNFDIDNRESDNDVSPQRSKRISSAAIEYSRGTPESLQFESNNVKHWTTEYILQSNFDRETMILTLKTDRLGNFGFAFPRYTHFPFRHWCLGTNEENPDELFFTLDTYHVRVVFIISKDGIRGHATDVPKEYVAKPVRYMEIEKPVGDLAELRKVNKYILITYNLLMLFRSQLFQDNNLNVFAEADASFYINQGYFCQKHLAAELHIYDAMTMHCKLLKFNHSDWNRLATDRDMVLCLRAYKDSLEIGDITVRVTPEAATFVEVSELCSDTLDIFNLHYQPTWRNMGTYSDLHQLINSMNPNATDAQNRDAGQMFYLRKLLEEIRPLSYS
ncbi:hypothetical protein KR038_002654 [Drosophila bunnanda]|nr:hypothetical protein KR038_002654 [Drosophila bunnanda]